MKKIILTIVAIVAIAAIAFVLYQFFVPKSPRETVTFNGNDIEITLEYSKPYKKGRLIFGEAKDEALLPYGQYWRLGANASTDITFSKDVLFAGKPVPAGTYRMYAVPGPGTFQIALNSEAGVSAAHNEPDYTKDVVKVDVPVETVKETEQLSISFSDASNVINMDIEWDKIRLRIPIDAQ